MDDLAKSRTIEIVRTIGAAIRLQTQLEQRLASAGIPGTLVTWEVGAWDHFEEAVLVVAPAALPPMRLRFTRPEIESFAQERPSSRVAMKLRAAAKVIVDTIARSKAA